MVEGKATLVVDLGNSETRVKTYFGKTASGRPMQKITQLSNMFARFSDQQSYDNIMANKEYNSANSRVFTLNGETYCTGLMQETEFSNYAIRPSGNVKKYKALESKLAICNAFCQGYEDIAKWTGFNPSELDITWNLTVLLPADDMELGAKHMAELAKSIQVIDFEMPRLKRELAIQKVNILPEGYCAFLGAVFERSGIIRRGYEKVMEPDTLTLIVDIGAGTTDLSIVNGGRLITNSKYTEPVGGNNVEGKLRQMLRHKNIPRVSSSKITQACETGLLEQGVKRYDVHDELNLAKKEVASELVQMIKEYQDYSNVRLPDVSYILVCGGGSMTVEEDERMAPITDYIIEFLKELTDGLELLELPVVNYDGDYVKASPRLLNVMGAGVASEGAM